MKTLLVRTIQWLTLLLSWLTLSPLFCYLSRKWQLIGKKVRMLLLLISPLMLIVYAVASRGNKGLLSLLESRRVFLGAH